MSAPAAGLAAARAFYERRRYADAIRALRSSLAAQPDDAPARALLALALVQSGETDAALHEAEAALALDPEDPYAHYALSVVQARRGNFGPAETAIRAAVALDPNDEHLRSQLALVQLARDRPRSAIESARAGLGVNPRDADLYVTTAGALIDLHRYDEAEAALREARALAPESPYVYRMLGTLEAVRGRSAAAAAAFREALRLNPTSAQARLGLVTALRLRAPLYRVARGRYARITGIGVLLAIGALANLPGATPFAITLFVLALIAFVLAEPLATMMVLFDRDGRRSLSRTETGETLTFAAALGVAAAAGLAYAIARTDPFGFGLAASLIPLAFLTFAVERKRTIVRRLLFGAVALWYATAALLTVLLAATGERTWDAAMSALPKRGGAAADAFGSFALLLLFAEFFVLAATIIVAGYVETGRDALRRITNRLADRR